MCLGLSVLVEPIFVGTLQGLLDLSVCNSQLWKILSPTPTLFKHRGLLQSAHDDLLQAFNIPTLILPSLSPSPHHCFHFPNHPASLPAPSKTDSNVFYIACYH